MAFNYHEQQLRVDLAYKIGLLKPGASLETPKEESEKQSAMRALRKDLPEQQ